MDHPHVVRAGSARVGVTASAVVMTPRERFEHAIRTACLLCGFSHAMIAKACEVKPSLVAAWLRTDTAHCFPAWAIYRLCARYADFKAALEAVIGAQPGTGFDPAVTSDSVRAHAVVLASLTTPDAAILPGLLALSEAEAA